MLLTYASLYTAFTTPSNLDTKDSLQDTKKTHHIINTRGKKSVESVIKLKEKKSETERITERRLTGKVFTALLSMLRHY